MAFQGIGSVLDESNRYVFPILRAEATTMSVTHLEDDDDAPTVSGEQINLVAGYQSRYNNRATISGSMQMCSNEFIWIEGTGNQRFCEQLLNWNFKQSGVLRSTSLRHNKVGERCMSVEECGPNPENYKLEDHIEFWITLEQMTEGQ